MEISASEDFYTSYSVRSKQSKCQKMETDPGNSYEVYRNNTTAVEVVVKEVPKKHTKVLHEQESGNLCEGPINRHINRMQKEIEDLRNELQMAHNSILVTKKGFRSLIFELKNQLDMTRERETEYQNKNLELMLENEKLKTLLATKASVLEKMRKEYTSFKRLLKCILKNLSGRAQAAEAAYETIFSENELYEIENEVRKKNKLIHALGDAGVAVINASEIVDHLKKM